MPSSLHHFFIIHHHTHLLFAYCPNRDVPNQKEFIKVTPISEYKDLLPHKIHLRIGRTLGSNSWKSEVSVLFTAPHQNFSNRKSARPYAMFITFLFLFGTITAFLASVESSGFMRKSIISPETVRILKGISFYHSGYFLSSAILSWFFISFVSSKLPAINLLESIFAIWTVITDFVKRLENNEYSYQCHFGLSIRSVRCEVYGNINRMLLLTSYQCLKYMQESFSYSDFNIFRILGFFAFLNTSIRQLVSIVKPLRLIKIIINNSILLVVHVVNGVYTLYNWRQIVQRLVIEEEIRNSKKLLKANQELAPLTITIAKAKV